MKLTHLLLPMVVLTASTLPAEAQLFGRKLRLNGMQAPDLIRTARTDGDERRRIAAVEQLREFDIKTYPDIVPNLIEVLLKDSSSAVRMETVHTLSRIRPQSPAIGQALQQAAQRDDHWRVRFQAKTQAWVNGYHGGAGNAQFTTPPIPTTQEPPLGGPITVPPAPVPSGQPIYIPSNPLPLIDNSNPASPYPTLPRPLPSRPVPPPPQQPGAPPPAPRPSPDDAPIIIPPSPTSPD